MLRYKVLVKGEGYLGQLGLKNEFKIDKWTEI